MLIIGGDRDAVNSRSVWAINETTGELIWSYDTGNRVRDIFVYNDYYIYIVGDRADNGDGNGNRNIWKLDHAGNYRAGYDLATATNGYSVVADASYVYVGTAAGGAYRLTHDINSSTTILASGTAFAGIGVDSSGNVYTGRSSSAGAEYFKYNSSLSLQWSAQLAANVVDVCANDTYNFVAGDGAYKYYNAAGTEQWSAFDLLFACEWNSDESAIHVVGTDLGDSSGTYAIIDVSDGSISGDTSSIDLRGVAVTPSNAAYVCGVLTSSYTVWAITGGVTVGLYNTTTTANIIQYTVASGTLARSDLKYTREMIAIGNDEVWYESAAGTMTELTDANGDIDVSDKLSAVSAFQKLFIANGGNLKVVDFLNTKITTTDAGVNPVTKGTILTGGTSTATMIADYASGVTDNAAASIYGYRTSSATFSSGETVTGTNGNGDAVSFVLSAAESAPPHWYNWTSFGNDTTTYGSMPSKAYMVTCYRGRLVLSGDINYPNRWWMSKVADPWSWLYTSNDPLSAVSAQNADAGELGDIVTALIPYGDDYLIMGCSHSIYMVTGDPAAGGRVDELSTTVGIFSQNSWCKDSHDNLYFFGTNGLYKMTGGRDRPQNISLGDLPKLAEDWALDPDSEQLALVYDLGKDAIIISKTNTETGANENYYYSLKTEGFYPEAYPEQCAIWGGVYYDALDPNYRKLALACNDGYIRYFDDAAKDDDIGSSDEAISSYVTFPVMALGDGVDREGRVTQWIFESSGGAASGEYSDTDTIAYDIYTADDAETLVEDIIDGATAKASGTIIGAGRQNRIRDRVRGMYGTVKLSNTTAAETWAINRIMYHTIIGGKL